MVGYTSYPVVLHETLLLSEDVFASPAKTQTQHYRQLYQTQMQISLSLAFYFP